MNNQGPSPSKELRLRSLPADSLQQLLNTFLTLGAYGSHTSNNHTPHQHQHQHHSHHTRVVTRKLAQQNKADSPVASHRLSAIPGKTQRSKVTKRCGMHILWHNSEHPAALVFIAPPTTHTLTHSPAHMIPLLQRPVNVLKKEGRHAKRCCAGGQCKAEFCTGFACWSTIPALVGAGFFSAHMGRGYLEAILLFS